MNDLQKLLRLRGITAADIAAEASLHYTSVQKVIKLQRQSPHIQQAVAEHLGLSVDDAFGPKSKLVLKRLITEALSERQRRHGRELRRRYRIRL